MSIASTLARRNAAGCSPPLLSFTTCIRVLNQVRSSMFVACSRVSTAVVCAGHSVVSLAIQFQPKLFLASLACLCRSLIILRRVASSLASASLAIRVASCSSFAPGPAPGTLQRARLTAKNGASPKSFPALRLGPAFGVGALWSRLMEGSHGKNVTKLLYFLHVLWKIRRISWKQRLNRLVKSNYYSSSRT